MKTYPPVKIEKKELLSSLVGPCGLVMIVNELMCGWFFILPVSQSRVGQGTGRDPQLRVRMDPSKTSLLKCRVSCSLIQGLSQTGFVASFVSHVDPVEWRLVFQ